MKRRRRWWRLKWKEFFFGSLFWIFRYCCVLCVECAVLFVLSRNFTAIIFYKAASSKPHIHTTYSLQFFPNSRILISLKLNFELIIIIYERISCSFILSKLERFSPFVVCYWSCHWRKKNSYMSIEYQKQQISCIPSMDSIATCTLWPSWPLLDAVSDWRIENREFHLHNLRLQSQ